MKHSLIIKSILAAVLIALVIGCASMDNLKNLPKEAKKASFEENLQQFVDTQVKKQKLVGIAMAVRLKDGTVIGKSSGYKDPLQTEEYTIDTRTIIGSLTKTFTAVVTLQLYEEGKLSLDQTVDSWFPGLPNADRITVRMLLSHTSGLNEYFDNPNVTDHKDIKWSPMSLVAAANEIGPVGEPGGKEGFYSNTNFVLLGMIIEEVTGNSWDREVEARIIEPLGLKYTMYGGREGALDRIAHGYTRKRKEYRNLLGTVHHSIGFSAGALTSSVSDLSVYAAALYGGKLFKKAETIELMLDPIAFQDMGMQIGLGMGMGHMELRGAIVKMHPGNIDGYQAFIGFDPDTGASVVATTNLQEGDVMMPSIGLLQDIKKYW
jgi:D-alanyl-D-alanine carboxypeptidase